MRTVLWFAYECSPHHAATANIAAQRPAALARCLPRAGWRAVVVACDGARRRTATRGDLPAIRAEVRERIRAAPPDASVVIPVPSLVDDGAVDRAWWRLAAAPPGSAGAWARRALTVAKWLSGDASQSWRPAAEAAAEEIAAAVRVDACLAEHSPDASLFLAAGFARRTGVPWGADFRDPILRPLGPMARRLYAPIARRLLRTAAFTVAVTQHWRDLDAAVLRRPAACVPNGFLAEEFAGPPPPPPDPGRVTVAYAGNLLDEQDATPFFRGLALLRKERGAGLADRLRHVHRGGQVDRVRRWAREHGVEDLVDVGPHVPRDEVLRLVRSADLLLLLSLTPTAMRDPLLARGLYPGKVFEYMGARRPILCVPGDGDLLDALVGETRSGVVCGDGAAVAAVLADAVDRRSRGDPIPHHPDEGVIAGYERTPQAAALAALLDRAVARARGSPTAGATAPGPARAETANRARRRVVMLVGNSVRYDQRVRRHASALAGAGDDVTVIGVTGPDEDPADVDRLVGVRHEWVRRDRHAGLPGIARRVASAAVHRAARLLWTAGLRTHAVADRTVAPAMGLLVAAARRFPADVVYAHDLNTLPAAMRTARAGGAALVYDAHEWYAGEEAGMTAARVAAIRRAEAAGVAAADAVLTVAEGVARRMAEAYGRAPVVIRNVPPLVDGLRPSEAPPRPLPLRVVYHSANLALGGRRLGDLIEAVALLEGRVALRLRGGATPARQRELLAALRARLRPGSWSLHPAVPHDALLRDAALADVGVVLNSTTNENEAATLPNKVFEYMMAGLAVVAFRTEAVAAVVEAEEAGVVVEEDSVEGLAAALAALEADRARVAVCGARGRAAVGRRHHWGVEAPILVRTLAGLGRREPAR